MGEEQKRTREIALRNLRVITDEDKAEHNFLHGELAGVTLFLSFPELLIESIDEELHDEFTDEEIASRDG